MICSMTSSGSCDIPQRVSTVMTNNKHCWLRQTQKKEKKYNHYKRDEVGEFIS